MTALSLDHLVLAVADLETGMAEFAKQTGCQPVLGGPHPGNGTCNALVAFTDQVYLEIIAPDPEQDVDKPLVTQMRGLTAPRLLHWAVGGQDLAGVRQAAIALGLGATPVFDSKRLTPAGELLRWQLLGLNEHGQGGAVPFYIDWGDTEHPSVKLPSVGRLLQLEVTMQDPQGLAALLPQQPCLQITQGASALSMTMQTPLGEVSYHSDAPTGFGF